MIASKYVLPVLCLLAHGCGGATPEPATPAGTVPDPGPPAVPVPDPGPSPAIIAPRVVTEQVAHDSDDPAIWIDRSDPSQSLVVGTDKDTNGALYAFDLTGKVVWRADGLKRPNNVDVAYGLILNGQPTDVAIVTERESQRLRVFRLPDLAPLDHGNLVVFSGNTDRAPMGIALYTRSSDQALFAVVGGKSGPADGYLWQYRIEDDGTGMVQMTKVREFGRYSGRQEIEAIAVDNELGYVYYSDERFGVRKYRADPDAPAANEELAAFGRTGFAGDHEGISIYKVDDGTGYLLVSDQQASAFQVFPREGTAGKPHEHPVLDTIRLQARDSDGSDVTNVSLPGFPGGLFVAMSSDRTFHYYSWADVAGIDLKSSSALEGMASTSAQAD